MIIVPGFLVTAATFPGVIVHESAHFLVCRLCRVAILDVSFPQIDKSAGHVIHEPPADFLSAFLICTGPFFINSLLCFIICFPAYLPIRVFGVGDAVSYALMWLGISIGMHAFPSNQDANTLWQEAGKAENKWNPLALLSFPIVSVTYAANLLRFFWLDSLYGFLIGFLVPGFILERLA